MANIDASSVPQSRYTSIFLLCGGMVANVVSTLDLVRLGTQASDEDVSREHVMRSERQEHTAQKGG